MKRTLLASLAASLVTSFVAGPGLVSAQPADCRSGPAFDAAQAEIERHLTALEGDQPLPRLEARLTELGWAKARQATALNKAFSTQALRALQQEKKSHMAELGIAVVTSSQLDPQVSRCDAARKVRSLAAKIMDVNRRQYEQAAREMGIGQGASK